ncbi:NAD(P)-dependent oxidoreductase [Methylomonas sp. SURF-2]|uniref:NAD(P)-dependent oxidoreductase n=1 Tax=Methylomonas subterranea TaxID=2952225 RepID=A0ABT1TD87_9GAMM|nr:NAD(P)-dependent oxidoreductase [Methylomonas sp. SURF-2]MCQ8103409.1 NAD(P)-dependent oxidoreductase [Methylomonas sp. SURF-2]
MQTGLIGLGAMGQGMARNLARAGHLQAVYNRSPGKADALAAELNVRALDSPAALAGQSELILLCVSADRDVLEVVTALCETIKPGSVVVDMSTVGSNTAKQAAALLANKQADFLDAPVSGGVEGAKNGTLAMMVGGDRLVLERVGPVLQAMTARIEHMGPTGSGQACKAVNQIMCAGINQAVTEALAFAQAQGLDMEKVVDVVSGGAAGNWFLQHRGKTMTKGVFKPGFRLALHHKDLLICRQMAEQARLECPLTDATLGDYELLMQQGFGDEDISALYRLKRTN